MLAGRQELQWERFFARLEDARSGALVLDYDGTLAPFKKDRETAIPYPGVRKWIGKIMAGGRTHVAIISGRPVEEVQSLLALSPHPEIWGAHGLQRLWPNGKCETFALSDSDRGKLRKAHSLLERLGFDSLSEVKPGSVAVHWRGLSTNEAEKIQKSVRGAWAPLAADNQMSLLDFDGGMELRVRGFDKGRAVLEVMRSLPARTPFAFLGDDTTDEDAFRALRATEALTVLVRPEWRQTEASTWIRPPEELIEFFREWWERSGGEQ